MSSFFTLESAPFGELQLLTVKSKALRKRADISVYIPQGLNLQAGTPLVILLHGVYGSHWAWAAKGKVQHTAQRLMDTQVIQPMILAMPSDGLFADGSAYVPHQRENYEAWIVEDVVQALREQCPAITTSSPLFITGLSMGGYGALRLGAKYPQVFRAFSGLSSLTHFVQMEQFVEDFGKLEQAALEKDGVLDWLQQNREQLPPFRFDCGVDDPLIAFNRQLHQDLLTLGIAHQYEEFPGAHSWEYWEAHIAQTLLFFNACI
jgi:enterochelin esterase-like enzyme